MCDTINRISSFDKCRHSQVDKKKHYVIQVISYRPLDRNTCRKYELWWPNGLFPGFRDGLCLLHDFSVAKRL